LTKLRGAVAHLGERFNGIDLAASSAKRGVGTPITLMPNTDKGKVIENCAMQIREIADILLTASA
jgi:hypothetical protein